MRPEDLLGLLLLVFKLAVYAGIVYYVIVMVRREKKAK